MPAGEKDAKLLAALGIASVDSANYADLKHTIKKYIQFAITEHTDRLPLWPLLPLKMSSLIRFGWWAQWNHVKGGMKSVKNYIGDMCTFAQSQGHPDPRIKEENKWIYGKFTTEAPKFWEIYTVKQTKLAITHEMFLALFMNIDIANLEHLCDAATYATLYFTAIRRGHCIPAANNAQGKKHLLRWEHIQFLPNIQNCQEVVFLLESGKIRSKAKKDPTWTATGRCQIAKVCPVCLLVEWYKRTFSGDPTQYVFARNAASIPPTSTRWTKNMRARLSAAATTFGLLPADFNVKEYSGISFRKGSLTALAAKVPPHLLAAHGDHKSVETTFKYYVAQTVSARASNTQLISEGFSGSARANTTSNQSETWTLATNVRSGPT
jgi:hypothetical protein